MPHYLLSAEATFSAAHTIPGVHMCERMHGHNWRVRATVRVEEDDLDQNGMGVDFRSIDETLRAIVSDFEHRYLNDLEPFKDNPPTAEWIAKLIARQSAHRLADLAPQARVEAVEVWETPQYRVLYRV
jgi:6-pyruvoyltetrahydropterin/6-carboxytetrahydropterin synthase